MAARRQILPCLLLSVGLGCKPVGQSKAPASTLVNEDDDGPIQIPMELETNLSLSDDSKLEERMRLSRKAFGKKLDAGSRLDLELRGVKSLRVEVSTKLGGKAMALSLEGSTLRSLLIDSDQKVFDIPLRGQNTEKLSILLPAEESRGLHVTSLSTESGDIVGWKIGKTVHQ